MELHRLPQVTSHIDKQANVLVAYSEGGQGHREAAKAMVSQLEDNGHTGKIVKLDILKGVLGKLGNSLASSWNNAQKKEKIWLMTLLYRLRFIANLIFFSLPVYFKVSRVLKEHKIDVVIDDQPNGTSWILSAIRKVNGIRRKNKLGKGDIHYYKVMTDLPMPHSQHFYDKISKRDKENYRLITSPPPPEAFKIIDKKKQIRESEQAYWKRVAGLDVNKHIMYTQFPVRKAFLEWSEKDIKKDYPLHLDIKVSNDEELRFLQNTVKTVLPLSAKEDEKLEKLQIPLKGDEQIYGILLGSQVPQEAVYKYIDAFAEQKRLMNSDKTCYLLIYCGQHSNRTNSLFKRVHEKIKVMKNLPANLVVVPMGAQSDEQLAQHMFCMDGLIRRSGGLTTMEADTVMKKGKSYIHIPTYKNAELKVSSLFLWEAGNAKYSMATSNAELIAPTKIRSLFQQAVRTG